MRYAIAKNAALLLAVAVALGCGGSAAERRSDPTPMHDDDEDAAEPVARPAETTEPIEIRVRVSRRFGELVRLDITGIGRKRPAKEEFENPRLWNITATAGNQMLTRAVNGPARIVRDPVGSASSDLWDVEVSFWVAFNVPRTVMSMVVRVVAPGSPVYEATLDLDWNQLNGGEVGKAGEPD